MSSTTCRQLKISRISEQISHVQFADDPDFPYVGKFIANITLAQLKTLDCGSLRQANYRERTTLYDWIVTKAC